MDIYIDEDSKLGNYYYKVKNSNSIIFTKFERVQRDRQLHSIDEIDQAKFISDSKGIISLGYNQCVPYRLLGEYVKLNPKNVSIQHGDIRITTLDGLEYKCILNERRNKNVGMWGSETKIKGLFLMNNQINFRLKAQQGDAPETGSSE